MIIDKKELRKNMLAKRTNLPWQEVQIKSQQINAQLFAHKSYLSAKTILAYLPVKKEPNSLNIIKNAWQQEKQVLVPVTCPETKSLLLSQLKSLKELTKGHYGIPEPKQKYLRPIDPLSVDICLLPGVAFNRNGFRLGYGGGYFDRFLPNLRSDCLKVALAYDFQILDFLPSALYDIPVDLIITESTIYNCTPEI